MVGRPPLFSDVQELQEKIDDYFGMIKDKEPATVTGLALFLGFESRQSFYDYESKEGFSYTIKRARLRIEHEYEKKLSGNNVTGPIFALKNLNWKDKFETGFTDGDGKDVNPVTIIQLPDNGRTRYSNPATEGLSGTSS